MWIYIGLGIVVVLAAFVAFVASRPSEFKITRSATIAAPADRVFEQVNHMQSWDGWSPWAKLDPNCHFQYDGPPAGVGSSTSWSGNGKVGAGKMTIVESRPYELIRIKLEFLRPFKSTSMAEFSFASQGQVTTVVWSMTGCSNFVSKLFCLFMDMDKMVGRDFEKGLAQMKSVCETAPVYN